MWAVILGLSGVGLATSLVAAAETLSNIKYICVGSTDDMVEALQVLDGVRALSGFFVCAVCAWGYMHKRMSVDNLRLYQGNVAALLVVNLATLFLGVVQKSDACSNCITDSSTTFDADLKKMLGGSPDCLLDKVLFSVPRNYCTDVLQSFNCKVGGTTLHSERCLVYSCTGFLPEYEFRYLYGIFGLTCQIVACLSIIIFDNMIEVIPEEGSRTATAKEYANNSQITVNADQLQNLPLPTDLRKRQHQKTHENEEHIHF